MNLICHFLFLQQAASVLHPGRPSAFRGAYLQEPVFQATTRSKTEQIELQQPIGNI